MSARTLQRHLQEARSSALAVWDRLTMSQRSKLLTLHYAGRHESDRTLQVLVRAGLAIVKIDTHAMHAYTYNRTGWGAFVSQIGAEEVTREEKERDAQHH